jgi:hypothetical protein
MRTKSVILGAALLAAGVASSMAQSNVYSLNVVGYINIPITNGFNLIANNLDFDGTGTNNLMTNVMAALNINQTVYKFDTNAAAFDIWQYTKSLGTWQTLQGSVPFTAATLNPGEGAFVVTTKNTNFTVVGQVLQGSWTNNYLVGGNNFCIASPQFPLSAPIDSTGNGGLAIPDTNNFSVYLWDSPNQSFDIWQWSKGLGTWSLVSGSTNGQTNVGGATQGPVINVGTSFFLVSKLTGWTNTFTVQ